MLTQPNCPWGAGGAYAQTTQTSSSDRNIHEVHLLGLYKRQIASPVAGSGNARSRIHYSNTYKNVGRGLMV